MQLAIKKAPNDAQSMAQDGDAILRSLQNENLPIIDLMVRESLQNSLDATLPDAKETIVDFQTKQFDGSKLAQYFEDIQDVLTEKFSGEQTVLAIKDMNTSGLNGSYTSNDNSILEKSNFHKLVFGIGKNQSQEGAGGSWGLGKTSYFRIGAGIVIYYTRVAVGDGFEERLVASLIESPKNSERLLPSGDRGIAWWGRFGDDENRLLPITDAQEITELLDLLGLNRYEGTQTGTTIIIPFVKTSETAINVVEETDDSEDGAVDNDPFKNYSFEEKINLASQRWYAPRMFNEKYAEFIGNSQLNCSINGTQITPYTNMEPTFKIMRDLYTSALIGEAQRANIHVEDVMYAKLIMETPRELAGRVAYCEVSREDVESLAPNYKPSALSYIGVKDANKIAENSAKVVAFTRKPGMIVQYDVDGKWSPDSINISDDNLLFAFFVPNSIGKLHDRFNSRGYETMEQYLRATENADHAEWLDKDGFNLVQRIKKSTVGIITDGFKVEEDTATSSATSGLSRKFGKLLMPPSSFGKSSSQSKPKSPERNVDSRNRQSSVSLDDAIIRDDNNVEVMLSLYIKKQTSNSILIQIRSQDSPMDIFDWQKAMGEEIPFPFEFTALNIIEIDGNNTDLKNEPLEEQGIKITIDEINKSVINVASRRVDALEIKMAANIKMSTNLYSPGIIVRSELENTESED